MKWRPYILIFKIHLVRGMSYRFNYVFGYLLSIVRLLIYLSVWRVIFLHREDVLGYTWIEMASYYALSSVALSLLYPQHMFGLYPLIRKGTLSAVLIKPINIEADSFAAFSASRLPVLILLSVITYLIFWLLGMTLQLQVSGMSLLLLGICTILTFYFGLFVSVLAFWLIEMWPLQRLFHGCIALLGGSMVPLDLMPVSLAYMASLSPFPYMGYFVTKALQGTMTPAVIQLHCWVALGWCLLFAVGFRVLWKLGLRQYEAVNL